jgi:tetratricopeptide (TPR) repeat protein
MGWNDKNPQGFDSNIAEQAMVQLVGFNKYQWKGRGLKMNNKHWPHQVFIELSILLALFFVMSCVTINDRTMSLDEENVPKIIGDVEIEFISWQPLHIMSNKKIKNKSYSRLMAKAQKKYDRYQDYIDVVNVTANGKYNALSLLYPPGAIFYNFQTITASGNVIYTYRSSAISEKEAMENADRLYNEGDYFKSIAEYTKAIEINPDNEQAYLNRGRAYSSARPPDWSQLAVSNLNSAISKSTDNMFIYNAYKEIGSVYISTASYQNAISAYERAKEYNPNSSELSIFISQAERMAQTQSNRTMPGSSSGSSAGTPQDNQSYYLVNVTYSLTLPQGTSSLTLPFQVRAVSPSNAEMEAERQWRSRFGNDSRYRLISSKVTVKLN